MYYFLSENKDKWLSEVMREHPFYIGGNSVLFLLINIFSMWATAANTNDPVGCIENEAWTKQWTSIGVDSILNPPHDLVCFTWNSTSNSCSEYSDVYMDDLIKHCDEAKQYRSGVGTSFGIFCFEIISAALALGYDFQDNYKFESIKEVAADPKIRLLSKRLGAAFSSFEQRLDDVALKQRSWKLEAWSFVVGQALALLWSLLMTVLPGNSMYVDYSFEYLLNNQIPALGGKFWVTVTGDVNCFIVSFMLLIVISGGLWGLHFSSGVRPAWILQVRNWRRARFCSELLVTKRTAERELVKRHHKDKLRFSSIDDKNALIPRDIFVESCIPEGGFLSSIEHFSEWVAYRDFVMEIMLRDHNRSESGIIGCLLTDVSLGTYVSFSYLVSGNFGNGVWGPWALIACPLETFFIFFILFLILDVHKAREAHTTALCLEREEMQLLRCDASLKGESPDEEVLKICENVGDRFMNTDVPFRVLGLSINPTFTRVLTGYMASLVGLIVIPAVFG